MKKILISLLIIILLIVSINPIISGKLMGYDKDIDVDLFEAEKIAQGKINSFGKDKLYEIYDKQTIFLNDEKQVLCYIFNLKPTGFIIVSSSYYLNPVIAYSFTSSYADSISNPLLDILKVDISSRLDNINILSYELKQNRINQWKQLKNPLTIIESQSMFEQWPPEGSSPTDGWILTQWHQNTPYNDFCPVDSESGSRGVAGCPSITMGQILYYHQTINNVRFNDTDDYYHNFYDRFWIDNDYLEYGFPSFPQLNDYLEVLEDHFDSSETITDEDIAALCFACGVAARQVYSPLVSGTYGVDQAYDAYLKFDCDTAELFMEESDELINKIISNIKNALPVHFAVVTPTWDSGHNIVIDGYNTDDYYHLNFGWGGSYDGWYHIPDDLPYDFTVIEGAVVDILNISTSQDLECTGEISLVDVQPESTITDSFTVENIGQSGSSLNWEVISYPDWGTWTINPDQGSNLTPEDGQVTVDISVAVPNKRNTDYTGGITVINSDNPSDRCIIPISISTPYKITLIDLIIQFIINHFPVFLINSFLNLIF
jgi:hypothetical protein